ncbi:GNAT family N-acetyltransferase [Janibacter melonis]|uniref:GNAT family N-acetyltransferase n=1 Tax=Janibacter melonis TaxID=262209 RepID=UPI0035563CFF
MGDQSLEEVAQTYEYVASLPAHDAYLVHVDDRPCALVQLYDPAQDPSARSPRCAEGPRPPPLRRARGGRRRRARPDRDGDGRRDAARLRA